VKRLLFIFGIVRTEHRMMNYFVEPTLHAL